MEKPRQIAFEVLDQHRQGVDFVEDILADALGNCSLPSNDRGLTHELVCGCVRWQRLLDWFIHSRTEGRPQQEIVGILLRLGLYQLILLDRIPPHAAVHETVEVAKSLGLGPVAGFINAFLRKASQELDLMRQQMIGLERSAPDIRHSHPEWLFRRWQARWGLEKAVRLMEWNNQPPPVYARVNLLRTTPAELEAAWRAEGLTFESCEYPWAPKGEIYRLPNPPALNTLKSFLSGGFYSQDPSTLLAVQDMDPQPGETVLDLCAAPGGKTALIAQRMRNQGTLIAQDTSRSRIRMIRDNCTRLGVTCVRVSTSTTVTHPELSLRFDRALVDAPCSNSGVMRRRVDLRWRIQPSEIERLRAIQCELLEDAQAQTRIGSLLVYSTCSIEPQENEEQSQHFASHHPHFQLIKEQQLLPMEHRVDGSYVSAFKRVK